MPVLGVRPARHLQISRYAARISRILFQFACEVDMLGTILLVVLILLLIGAFPAWPRDFYRPDA